MNAPSSQQASRRRPVPAQLQHYIEMANILPAPERLPGAEGPDKFPGVQLEDSLPILEHWQYDYAYIQMLIDQFSRFREFMAGADLQAQTFPNEVFSRCRRLQEVRSLLYTIARWPAGESSGVHITIAGRIEKPLSLFADEGEISELKPTHFSRR